jgi:hypothetical protein
MMNECQVCVRFVWGGLSGGKVRAGGARCKNAKGVYSNDWVAWRTEEWKRSASGWGQRNGRGVRAGGARCKNAKGVYSNDWVAWRTEEWKRSASGWGQRNGRGV